MFSLNLTDQQARQLIGFARLWDQNVEIPPFCQTLIRNNNQTKQKQILQSSLAQKSCLLYSKPIVKVKRMVRKLSGMLHMYWSLHPYCCAYSRERPIMPIGAINISHASPGCPHSVDEIILVARCEAIFLIFLNQLKASTLQLTI